MYTRPAEFAKAWRYHSLLLLSFEWPWPGEHQSWKMPSSLPWWRRDTFLLGFHSKRNARSTLWNASLGDISSLNLLLTSSCCHQEAHITAPCTGSNCKFFIIVQTRGIRGDVSLSNENFSYLWFESTWKEWSRPENKVRGLRGKCIGKMT